MDKKLTPHTRALILTEEFPSYFFFLSDVSHIRRENKKCEVWLIKDTLFRNTIEFQRYYTFIFLSLTGN